jgi:HlyD family secretion protein
MFMSQQLQSPGGQGVGPSFDEVEEEEDLAFAALIRRRRRRRIILIVSIVLVVIILAALLLPALAALRRKTTYQYQSVTQGAFDLTVSSTGPVQTGTYNVVFSGSGKISEIDVAVGQSVIKGQLLARLDKTSLQDALNEAQTSALTAQANYNSQQNSFAQTQSQTQASVAAAQTALADAQAALARTQSQSETSISAALQSLTNDQLALTRTQQQSLANNNAAQAALNNGQAALSKAQAQASAQILLAKQVEQQSILACDATATATAQGTPATTPLSTCLNIAMDTYNQAVAQANANVQTAQNAVTTAQQQLKTTQAQSIANNTSAQNKVNTDQSSISTTMSTSAANNTTAQNSVNSAMGSLSSTQAQAQSTNATAQAQATSAQGTLKSALAALQTAQHNLKNATLTAPHAGIVSQVNGTVGGSPGTSASSSVSAGTSTTSAGTFVQIIDTSSLQVQAQVNEADAGNLKVGQPAVFSVSAYGSKVFHGTVGAISPNGQTANNVVSYPVTIDVDMNSLRGSTLLPNMTADITITVIHKTGVLLLPVTAITYAQSAVATATTNNGRSAPIISRSEANVAMDQARQRLLELQNEHPDGTYDTDTPAFVIERSGNLFIARPVVLAQTDETVYVVAAGLGAGESVLTGSQ